jgi:hypothetical protein
LVTYLGDQAHQGSRGICEPFRVEQLESRTVTQVHDSNHGDITGQQVPVGTVVHDQATVVGNGVIVPTGSVEFDLYADPNCSAQTIISTEIVPLDLAGTAESSLLPGLPAGSYGYLVNYSGDQTYLRSQALCEPFEIIKLNPEVVTQVHDSNHVDVTNGIVPAGSSVHDKVTVSGTSPVPTGTVDFNLFQGKDCLGPLVSSEPGVPLVNGMAESASAVLAIGGYGYIVSYNGDSFYNAARGVCEPFEVRGPTRTLGFWQTHLDFAQSTFAGMDVGERLICGSRTIDDMPELMGGFWSSIPYKTTGIKRNQVDQARMQLIQQLLAAMLNKEAFGTDDSGAIAAGKAAFCTNNRSSILAATGALGAYNQSGDSVPSPVPTGSANPQAAQAIAYKPAWDVLP